MSAHIARCAATMFAIAASLFFVPSLADDPPAGPPAERVFDLDIRGGKLTDAARAVRVKQGESVRLRWTADVPVVVHMHGYNLERHVEPGATADMAFTARATGRFAIYLHVPGAAASSHRHGPPLVTFEVFPR